MSKIRVFNQTNRLVACTEDGISIAPLQTHDVNADDQIAAFAIEKGWLVVLSYPETAEPTIFESEPIQVEEVAVSESEPIQVEETAVEPEPEPEPETEEVSEDDSVTEEAPEEVKTPTRTRKKTSTQVKES